MITLLIFNLELELILIYLRRTCTQDRHENTQIHKDKNYPIKCSKTSVLAEAEDKGR
jgi:hypothetical protein